MVVDLFIPCFIDKFYPETGRNTLKILRKAGCDVNYNSNQTCCGQPLYNSGDHKDALKIAKKFLNDFPQYYPTVAPSASCAGYVRNEMQNLSNNESFLLKHKVLKSNIYELSDFLVNLLRVEDFGVEFNAKVTYHDSCTALRKYGIKQQPRILLNNVKGLELIEMKESEVCCGFGGSFAFNMEAISIAMAKQKIANAMETGAEYIVSTEASCLMHLESVIKKNNYPIKTIHLADILASGW